MRSFVYAVPFACILAATAAVFALHADDVADSIPSAVGDQWDALLAAAKRRLAVRSAIVDDVIAGRRSLSVAAEQFQALDVGRPCHVLAVCNYPGRTTTERYARAVIGHVDAILRNDPRRASVAARLNVDLVRLLTADEVRHGEGVSRRVAEGGVVEDAPHGGGAGSPYQSGRPGGE